MGDGTHLTPEHSIFQQPNAIAVGSNGGVRRFVVSGVFALLLGLVGPLVTGPRGRGAVGPFVYHPPDGFIVQPSPDAESTIWIFEETVDSRPLAPDKRAGAAVRAVLHHSTKQMSVEETDLAKLAAEMPKAFADACTWVHRRHELRQRSDGGRVGLIEGDCNKAVDLSGLGLPEQTLRSRKLQLMFPDGAGTAIVTASYPTDQAARWEPLFEATINKAEGVAVRVASPPFWTRLAWAAAGAILGWLVSALAQGRGDKPLKPDEPSPSKT
jgi:hypothetical protein